MGSPVIFNGNYAKTLKDSLKLGENAYLITDQTANPTSSAFNAPQGSLYFRNGTNEIYRKTDNGSSTNWTLISDHGGLAGLSDNDHPQYHSRALELQNIRADFSVSANALTITINGQNGSSLSSTNYASVAFANVSTHTGYTVATLTSSISLTVPSGATLGHGDGLTCPIYVYLQYNSGTPEVVVSSALLDETSLQTSTTISTSADTSGIYAATGRSNQQIRLIGLANSLQTTAGTWASNVSKAWSPMLNTFAVGTQYTASSTSANVQSSPSASTYYIPDASTNVTVPPGVYKATVQGIYRISNSTNSTQAQMLCRLGTSSTPGSSMIAEEVLIGTAIRNSSGDEYQNVFPFSFDTINFTLTNVSTIYINFRYINAVGTPTVTNMGTITSGTATTLRLIVVRVG
jgi:hypothetical protein